MRFFVSHFTTSRSHRTAFQGDPPASQQPHILYASIACTSAEPTCEALKISAREVVFLRHKQFALSIVCHRAWCSAAVGQEPGTNVLSVKKYVLPHKACCYASCFKPLCNLSTKLRSLSPKHMTSQRVTRWVHSFSWKRIVLLIHASKNNRCITIRILVLLSNLSRLVMRSLCCVCCRTGLSSRAVQRRSWAGALHCW